MVFIPRENLEHRAKGQWVRLTRDIDVMAGRFTKGTVMQIIDSGPRGLNLQDQDGNPLSEIRAENYEPANDPTYDWHDKN